VSEKEKKIYEKKKDTDMKKYINRNRRSQLMKFCFFSIIKY